MNDNLICDKDCIKDLRPYEKCISLGEQSLTDTELIAAIIKTGVSGKPAGELAKDILDKSHNKGLLGLFDMSIDELMDIKGIGLAKAAQLKCICELSRRLAKQSAGKRLDFSSPYAIAEYYMQDMRHLTKERLVLVMLDSRLNLLKDSVISIGTVNSSLVSVKEVFSEACKNKAVSIVLIHNHPSGDPAPSPQDISVTEQIVLNNDTEMITPTAINELLGCCMREDVGVVGAKLLYSDDTVQHAGVVVGFGGYAGHVNIGIRRDDYGYMVRAQINCNYSAVTAACMITKKELFEQVGGFDEQFVVACNDVDYCLKVRETGKWVVFNAFSEWYHYESKSRGYEDTPEKLKRFEGEVAKFQKKWPEILEKGDPFYNPNFPIDKAPFTLG